MHRRKQPHKPNPHFVDEQVFQRCGVFFVVLHFSMSCLHPWICIHHLQKKHQCGWLIHPFRHKSHSGQTGLQSKPLPQSFPEIRQRHFPKINLRLQFSRSLLLLHQNKIPVNYVNLLQLQQPFHLVVVQYSASEECLNGVLN